VNIVELFALLTRKKIIIIICIILVLDIFSEKVNLQEFLPYFAAQYSILLRIRFISTIIIESIR